MRGKEYKIIISHTLSCDIGITQGIYKTRNEQFMQNCTLNGQLCNNIQNKVIHCRINDVGKGLKYTRCYSSVSCSTQTVKASCFWDLIFLTKKPKCLERCTVKFVTNTLRIVTDET